MEVHAAGGASHLALVNDAPLTLVPGSHEASSPWARVRLTLGSHLLALGPEWAPIASHVSAAVKVFAPGGTSRLARTQSEQDRGRLCARRAPETVSVVMAAADGSVVLVRLTFLDIAEDGASRRPLRRRSAPPAGPRAVVEVDEVVSAQLLCLNAVFSARIPPQDLDDPLKARALCVRPRRGRSRRTRYFG